LESCGEWIKITHFSRITKEEAMSIKPRPYQGLKDFIAMTSILAIGRKTDTNSHYVHTGDLSWWMFYGDRSDSHWTEHICLWELDGQTVGWTLLDPDWRSFDIYLLPRLRGSVEEEKILDWSIDCLSKIVRQQGDIEIQTMWVAEHDAERILQLEQRGFERGAYTMWYLERPLEELIPETRLPIGYSVRQVDREEDIKPRAAAAHQTFGSGQPFEEYWPRYQRFVNSPVYISSVDLVTIAPEGDFSSFCIAWPDPVNHTGLFEPVGIHPEFQSQGLGRAVVTEGLRQLQNCGMDRAAVSVEIDDLATQGLYEAVGFQKQYQLYTYVKNIR
jgi:ribosomal protein S18 acetylase RimI-like enzyme